MKKFLILSSLLAIALCMFVNNPAAAQSKKEAKKAEKQRKLNKNDKLETDKMYRYTNEELRRQLEEELKSEQLSKETEEPCYFPDDEEFIYATYKESAFDAQMARNTALNGARRTITQKIAADSRYKNIVEQGIPLSVSTVCEQMGREPSGNFICYIAIRVAREDLDKYLEQLDK